MTRHISRQLIGRQRPFGGRLDDGGRGDGGDGGQGDDGGDAYGRLMAALGDDLLGASDAEVLAAVDTPAEAEAMAAQVRRMLLGTAKDFRQRRLRAAATEYRRRVQALQMRWVDLPALADDRRQLLSHVFAAQPAMRDVMVTVQHRSFKELTDADVASCLVQLAELGAVDLMATAAAARDEAFCSDIVALEPPAAEPRTPMTLADVAPGGKKES